MAEATTRCVNHLLSAGTTYHGAWGVAVFSDHVLVDILVIVPEGRAPSGRPRKTSSFLAGFVESGKETVFFFFLLRLSRHGGKTSGWPPRLRARYRS